MHYILISFSHKNSDILIREKLSFSEDAKKNFLQNLTAQSFINEATLLSTCNRVEIFASVNELGSSMPIIFALLSEHSGLAITELEGRADRFENDGAIHHLFSVAGSLDSLVVGETQIAGQVKEAFKFAYDGGFAGQKISRAMHYAFRCAAEIKNQTQIAKNPVSVASVAIAKAKSLVGGLDGKSAIIIGAGEMGRLACKYLIAENCRVILVNRTLATAKEFAAELDSSADIVCDEFFNLKELLCQHPLVFSATGAQHPIIEDYLVGKADFERYWFDISVPRDINISKEHGVHVFTVDDLKDIVENNLALRSEEARIAYRVVGQMTVEFFKWIGTLSVDPLIKALRQKAKDAANAELKRAIKKGFVPKEHEEAVEKLVHAAFKKFLHEPTVNIKALSDDPKMDNVLETVKYLFSLDSKVKVMDHYKCEYASMHAMKGDK
ncbi:MAG: hypothetical protein RL154_1376 [Pseudomonadota bacterium]|jgi:glutamyl-tRNA reductase